MRISYLILACVMSVVVGCDSESVEMLAPPGSKQAELLQRAALLTNAGMEKLRYADLKNAGMEKLRATLKHRGADEPGDEEEYEGYADSDYDEEQAANEEPAAPAPVPVPVVTQRTLQRLDPVSANGSSEAPSSKNAYDASNAIDRNAETWWGEGVSGDGIGEWLEYSWSGTAEVREIRLISGYQKEVQDTVGDRWPLNNRLRRVTVIIPGATSFDASLEDRRGFQTIAVPPGNFGTSVRIVMMDVYPGYNAAGKHIEDSGIAEIEVLGLR